jgi:virginiamycin A acetyltransferase
MKPLIKTIAFVVSLLFVLPCACLLWLGSAIAGRERLLPGWSQVLSLLPGISGVYLRRAFYWWVLPEVGKDVWIGFGTVLSHPSARFGDRVYVGVGCMLGDVTLEEDVLLGSHVSIINGNRQHGIERLDMPIREQPGEYPRVTVGRDSWIGDRSIVLADVGPQCIVGAGSVVTKPLPARAIAVGNPARVLRFRDDPAAAMRVDHIEMELPLEAIAASQCEGVN